MSGTAEGDELDLRSTSSFPAAEYFGLQGIRYKSKPLWCIHLIHPAYKDDLKSSAQLLSMWPNVLNKHSK